MIPPSPPLHPTYTPYPNPFTPHITPCTEQFYCWYFHALPLLLWKATALPIAAKLAVFVLLEYAWSYGLDAATGSSTPASSVALQVAHVALLAGLWFSKRA